MCYTSWKIIQTFGKNENIGYDRFGKNNGKFQFFILNTLNNYFH